MQLMKRWNNGGRDDGGPRRKTRGYRLRLYITGVTPKSTRALRNIKALCERHLLGRYDLEVIDIYQDPLRARTDQILAIPTLVKCAPLPIRRFIGDMSQTDKILSGLDLGPGDDAKHEDNSAFGDQRRF